VDEGSEASLTSSPHVSSPYVDDDEPDDFKSNVPSEDEDAHASMASGMSASPMLDESIMSHNATLALDSRERAWPHLAGGATARCFPRARASCLVVGKWAARAGLPGMT